MFQELKWWAIPPSHTIQPDTIFTLKTCTALRWMAVLLCHNGEHICAFWHFNRVTQFSPKLTSFREILKKMHCHRHKKKTTTLSSVMVLSESTSCELVSVSQNPMCRFIIDLTKNVEVTFITIAFSKNSSKLRSQTLKWLSRILHCVMFTVPNNQPFFG